MTLQRICTILYQILLNGSRFFPYCGLKQWDPLSPYMCATMLSLALLEAQFQRICKGIGLQEIWTLIDCIIFIQGTNDMQHSVLKILRWYCILFGQIVTFDKSEVFSILSLVNIV